jgi:hypothetical protein
MSSIESFKSSERIPRPVVSDSLTLINSALEHFSEHFNISSSHPGIAHGFQLINPRAVVVLGEFHCDKRNLSWQQSLISLISTLSHRLFSQKTAVLCEGTFEREFGLRTSDPEPSIYTWEGPIYDILSEALRPLNLSISTIQNHFVKTKKKLEIGEAEEACHFLDAVKAFLPEKCFSTLKKKIQGKYYHHNRKRLVEILNYINREAQSRIGIKTLQYIKAVNHIREKHLVESVHISTKMREKPLLLCGNAHACSKYVLGEFAKAETPYLIFSFKGHKCYTDEECNRTTDLSMF